jgi:hypothetical protein
MKRRLFALFTLVLAIAVLPACNPEEDTIAEVKVITPNGTAVPGAEVRLFGQGTIDETQVGNIRIDEVQFTNDNGLAVFDFTEYYEPGQSGFAILNVEITKDFPDSTAFLEGIMRVVEEETTRKTFTLGE